MVEKKEIIDPESKSMKDLSNINFEKTYRTSSSYSILDTFLKPCYENSIIYDRAAGYFTSGILDLIVYELKDFAQRGGKLRLICSTQIDPEDVNAMAKGYKLREDLIEKNIHSEVDNLMKLDSLKFEILASLIALNVMEIKIAIRKGGGIYHEKIGIFKDDCGNTLSFKGSANETLSAWSNTGNYESIDVYPSWDLNDHERSISHSIYFDRLWENLDSDNELIVIPFPHILKEFLQKKAKNSIDEIKWDSLKRLNVSSSEEVIRTMYDHQRRALDAWKLNNYCGILEHATGSGKTFTAINAIKQHYNEDSGFQVLVLVPSILLLEQWYDEISDEISDINILCAGGGNNKWNKQKLLPKYIKYLPSQKRLVLATYDTASKPDFFNAFNSTDKLLLVADECHRSGSSKYSMVFNINAKKRLGLSATPERYEDEIGTEKILKYFTSIIHPPYTLNDAIRDERLTPYEYHPELINLLPQEQDDWLILTKQIKKEYAKLATDSDGNKIESFRIKKLLIDRKSILKSCHDKISYALDIVSKNYQTGQKWLIYCENSSHLEEIKRVLKVKYPCLEYHSKMIGSRKETLNYFNDFSGIMLSIKCLDEGIDIPDISHAIILASSNNPREFIQRRGRVLRKALFKTKAVIYDTIVAPNSPEDAKQDSDLQGILANEMRRALEFSENALNMSSKIKLLKIKIDHLIND